MKHYLVHTLGCKVNQCESAAIARALDDAGHGPAGENHAPDLVVINTCAVTGRAGMQSRGIVRRMTRCWPQARIVVTGCYAQIAASDLQGIAGVDLIVGHTHKLDVARWLTLCNHSQPGAPVVLTRPVDCTAQFAALGSAAVDHRTRAFLKIQDGCNTCCTYCVVPLARGRSRSMPAADVFTHLGRLGRLNYHEVVLTGIHLGAWGRDLDQKADLAGLLQALLAHSPVDRIRLSSIEPTEIDERLLTLMAADKGLCRHWHIPLQSGDDGVLRRMGRGYGREDFRAVIIGIHARIPAAAIGVDVLVGFPGEDDQAFDHTFRLLESLPVAYLHVFPYSRRPGTPAAGYTDQVHPQIIKNRCRRLRRLGEAKRRQFYRSQLGARVQVLVETAGDRPSGTSDNYLPVVVMGAAVEENTLVDVRLEDLSVDGMLIGRLV